MPEATSARPSLLAWSRSGADPPLWFQHSRHLTAVPDRTPANEGSRLAASCIWCPGACLQRRRPKSAGWVSNPPRRPGHPPGRRSLARALVLRGDPGPEDSHSGAEVLQAPSAQLLGRARIVDVGGDDERTLPRCPTAITCDLQGGVSNPANDPRGEGRPHIVCRSRTLAFGSHPAAWPVS